MPKPPAPEEVRDSAIDDDKLKAYTEAFRRTGFYGTNALYMNHRRNREFNLTKAVNDARLEFPVLFVEAKYDTVCAVHTTNIAEMTKEMALGRQGRPEEVAEGLFWLSSPQSSFVTGISLPVNGGQSSQIMFAALLEADRYTGMVGA